MIFEFLRRIYDFIIFFLYTFFKSMIPDSSPKYKEYIDSPTKSQILYPKTDSLLLEEPNSSSNIIIVINKGIKVEYQGETKTNDDGEIYDKVKILKHRLYDKEFIGFILRRQLSDKIIREEKNSISIKSKTKIIIEATKILKSKTGFSKDEIKRTSGFFSKKYDDKFYFDCSSFCSCILNRIFDFPPHDENNIKVWTTNSFFENIQKRETLFDIIETVNVQGKCLNLKKLQIGDLILGRASYINDGVNHIMLYAGEEYIIHCTKGRYLGIQTNQMRNGVVKERLNKANYYTELESLENIQNGNITKRFDVEILVLRYKEKR